METDFNHTDHSLAEEQMMLEAAASENHNRSSGLCGGNMAELRSVGQVEISDEVRLEDLKTQVECAGFVCIQHKSW